MMEDNKLDGDILLTMIAESLGGRVVTWNNVNETIERKISFAKIVDLSKYMSQLEMRMIEERSFVGELNEESMGNRNLKIKNANND